MATGCCNLFLIATVVVMSITRSSSESPQVLNNPWSKVNPVIDGVIDIEEWNDAHKFQGVSIWKNRLDATKRPTPEDLRITGWTKHNDSHLLFAFNITDDILFGIDIPRWTPPCCPAADNLTRQGYPWFGDEMEILITSRKGWQNEKSLNGSSGDAGSWQMVLNFGKSRLHGIGPHKGGLMEGEPRSKLSAWNTYQHWIYSGLQVGATRPRTEGPNRGYEAEWAISFKCLEIEKGVYYSADMPTTDLGLNIALGDVDMMKSGEGNPVNIHHEMWFAGPPKSSCPGAGAYKSQPCDCTDVRNLGSLRLEAKP